MSRAVLLRRRLSAVLALGLLAAAGFVWLQTLGGVSRAAAQSGAEPTPQTDDSVPAGSVTMIGSSPGEAPGETWGVGLKEGGGAFPSVLVRYTTPGGWTLGPDLLDPQGRPLEGFRLYRPNSGTASPLAGQMTPGGNGVLAGELPPSTSGGESVARQVLLVRNSGGSFRQTATEPEGEAALKPGEQLYGAGRAPLIAALDEGSGRTGALVVPTVKSGIEAGVLHWDGSTWTREKIEVPSASAEDFRVLALGASSPANAWLLAQLSSSSSYPVGAVALFRRNEGKGGEPPTWQAVATSGGAGDGEAHPLIANERRFTVAHTGEPPTVQAQVLTVTSDGVWVDGERADVQTPATLFFKPEGTDGGHVLATWCRLPASAPGGTPECNHDLGEPLPSGPSRSFAWANPGTPEGLGERVITGLPEGVSLRLDGTTFTPVLALGGGPEVFPGGTYGAAFSNPREGWLGEQQLPVHLTLNPAPSRLTPWPAAFRHALLSVAAQPGVPVGSLSSQALAVGDRGEVARYEPGKGWRPESLFGTGGRHETPRLRAVAWPTPDRAFAVGDSGNAPQMWLWRGETGLWEPDPAIPYNFRGNLMGIAFDPANPARGYAVGESGVLLSYGKSWTQETALPPEVAGASFTSVAFAGSEAIVAYRKLLDRSRESSYVGGLLVNDGSGWRVDAAAAAAMGEDVPLVVAGLPDGGAAFAARSFTTGEGARIFERDSSSSTWQPAATPFPGGGSPGSLALFREGGALRAVASGNAPGGFEAEGAAPSPPGFPPPLVGPYGLGSNTLSGVLRQTAGGWSDEEHELNDAREPPGQYSFYDTVYQPDPIAAVLIDPSGGQGWAVGGFVDNNPGGGGVLDTAEIARYPADGVAPTGVGTSPVKVEHRVATFAIGGNAECAAPCADRAQARIGPDAWLGSALQRAGQIEGVRAFLYTGPRVTTGETVGPATLALPYAKEIGRYGSVLSTSPLPTFAAASATDLNGEGGESYFLSAVLGGFPQPIGGGAPAAGITRAGAPAGSCGGASGCQSAYYAFESSGGAGTVRVIVLDTTPDVGPGQLAWLRGELAGAKSARTPAIVVGNADLAAQIAAGDTAAKEVARVLVGEGNPQGAWASAYFFDSPERNVSIPLQAGAAAIPTFGSGTLGYIRSNAESSGSFLGASGFLLGQVDTASRSTATNVATVTAELIPNIEELALEAKDGTLLRRSNAALFAALARRPRAGNRSSNKITSLESDPYIPIPSNCVGPSCATGIFPKYTFSSSRPDIGDFVAQNLASSDPHAVLLGPEGVPVPDRTSELFCAYNAGTTIVTISAGGLSSSLPVTVQAGSVRRPCGTTPLKELPPPGQQASVAPPAPAPTPAGTAPTSSALPPIVPVPPTPAVLSPPAPRPTPTPTPTPPAAHPFLLAAPPTVAILGVVPPPLPTPARPTPPSGTSAVTSPVEAPEREEEEEGATESVSNQAAAYRSYEHEPAPAYILGLVVLAAFAGASARRRPRRDRREVGLARATVSSRQIQGRGGRRRRD